MHYKIRWEIIKKNKINNCLEFEHSIVECGLSTFVSKSAHTHSTYIYVSERFISQCSWPKVYTCILNCCFFFVVTSSVKLSKNYDRICHNICIKPVEYEYK